MGLSKGDIAVFDKGYVNYNHYEEWTEQGIFYVAREKDNASYNVTVEYSIPENAIGRILTDEFIQIAIPGTNRVTTLRRVKYKDPESKKIYVFRTNHMHISALHVADFYKSRWEIETFCKKIKQNFNLRYFFGDSQNAIEIQIWACLIVNLLYQVLLKQSHRKWDYSNFTSFVRIHLWTCIFLADFLNDNEFQMRKRLNNSIEPPNLFTPSG